MKTTMTITRCDFDRTEGAQTIRFGLDGRDYEIDLSAKREKQLREALAPYVDKARKPTATPRTVVRSAGSRSVAQRSNADVRAWAIEQGYEVSDRGRIRADIIAEYDAAVGR